ATFLLPGRPVNTDPLHRIATVLQGDAFNLALILKTQSSNPDWQERWTRAQSDATSEIDAKLRATASLFGGKVPWLLSQC
ncbi:MAG: hypothetical protein ACPGC0_05090, partial [Opitutales bacterium]